MFRTAFAHLCLVNYFGAWDDAEGDDCDNNSERLFETKSRKASGFSTFAKYFSKKKVCSNARSDFRAAMNGTRQSPWTYRHGLLTSYEYENLTAPLPIAFAQWKHMADLPRTGPKLTSRIPTCVLKNVLVGTSAGDCSCWSSCRTASWPSNSAAMASGASGPDSEDGESSESAPEPDSEEDDEVSEDPSWCDSELETCTSTASSKTGASSPFRPFLWAVGWPGLLPRRWEGLKPKGSVTGRLATRGFLKVSTVSPASASGKIWTWMSVELTSTSWNLTANRTRVQLIEKMKNEITNVL